ncbi:MAG TPA: hypothetical protein VFQ76_17850, partial [Longimicrobiaceae bacterium]|nr:hypothetical protein [Longimicrobiaceae bacterium]
MSNPLEGTPASTSLQFDSAEPVAVADAPATTTCTGCSRPIRDSYHEVNGQVVCASCRAGVEALGKSGGFAKALVFGIGAAAAGWAVYFAVLKLAGIEFGLIAILVGYVVGKAVSNGSGGRGGWPYQTLAIGLTYLAIVCTYVPLIAGEMAAQDPSATGAGLYVVSFVIAVMYPFLSITESPIGAVIIAVGLYEAWKLNKRGELRITGPYTVAAPQPVPA